MYLTPDLQNQVNSHRVFNPDLQNQVDSRPKTIFADRDKALGGFAILVVMASIFADIDPNERGMMWLSIWILIPIMWLSIG